MALRKVRPLTNNEYIEKYIDITITDIDLPQILLDPNEFCSQYKYKLPHRLFLAYAQQLQEIYIWRMATFEELYMIAPIVNIYFSSERLPIVVYPRFTPLLEEMGDERQLQGILKYLNCNYSELEEFLKQVPTFCDNWGLNSDDILCNYNNIGYHPIFGFRIIDYGLTHNIHSIYDEIKERQ